MQNTSILTLLSEGIAALQSAAQPIEGLSCLPDPKPRSVQQPRHAVPLVPPARDRRHTETSAHDMLDQHRHTEGMLLMS